MSSPATGTPSELLSDEWIDQARKFLQANTKGMTFSFTEVFADPPPGIHDAWHVRVVDGAVEAGPGVVPDTDLRVDSDYQAMLAIVQTASTAGPDAIARTHREIAHRHGRDVMRLSGGVPAEASGVLAGLHDHMAARTIDNPHPEHRIRRLGLEQRLAELTAHGSTIVESAISDAYAEELRERVDAELRVRNTTRVSGLLGRHRLFEEIASHPIAVTLARGVIGPDPVLDSIAGHRGSAGRPDAGPAVPDTDAAHRVTAVWVLAEPEADAPDDKAVPRGSVTLYAGAPPQLPDTSIGLVVAYTHRGSVRSDDFGAIGADHFRRNAPAFRALIGLDGATT